MDAARRRWRVDAGAAGMLSRRQIKEADRVGGIELMLPWPASLPPPPADDLGVDEERPARPTEHLAAMQIVAADCERHGLVPVRVSVARTARIEGTPPEYYLAVIIIGRRWVHARTSRQAKTMWANVDA
jgi:hypothetical protein